MTIYNQISKITDQNPPNFDMLTGIHYGVIHQNHLDSDTIMNAIDGATDLTIEAVTVDAKEDIDNFLEELLGAVSLNDKNRKNLVNSVWNVVRDSFLENLDLDEHSYVYEKDGYRIHICSDGYMIIVKSPYYSFRQQCSPCYPNAGDLESEGNLKTYCLDPDWYENQLSPSKIYSVKEKDASLIWNVGDKFSIED